VRYLLVTVLILLGLFMSGARRDGPGQPPVVGDQSTALDSSGLRFTINKFGFNADIDTTEEAIFDLHGMAGAGTGPLRCFDNMATTPAALYISSDDENDAGKGVTVEALDANWNPVTVATTLGSASASGTVFAQVGSSTLLRVNRAYATSTALVGNVYIGKDASDGGTDGIPDTVSTDLVAGITKNENQTLQACYTVPLGYNALMTDFCFSNVSQAAAGTSVTFRIRKSVAGEAKRNQMMLSLGNEVSQCQALNPPIKFTEKTDIEITGSNATSQSVAATFGLVLVSNTLKGI